MKTLIIEDELLAATQLANFLKEIAPEVTILDNLDRVKSAVNWFKSNPPPDLIFLDIQLADGKCFNIFDEVEVKSPVIFTTAYDEYAVKAFELNSIDYLLKPLNKNDLSESIKKFKNMKQIFPPDKLASKINKFIEYIGSEPRTYKTRFLVNKGSTFVLITSDKIAYFYSEDKATFIMTNDNRRFIINHSLDNLEKMLNPEFYFRINRQIILSLNSIEKIHSYFNYKLKVDIEPPHGTDVIVSRLKVTDFKNWLCT